MSGLIQSEKVKVKVGKSAVHTLNMAVAAWSNVRKLGLLLLWPSQADVVC